MPNFQGAQFSQIGLPQVFVEIIFADGEPHDLLPDLLKCLLITVIVLLDLIMRCHSDAEGFRRIERIVLKTCSLEMTSKNFRVEAMVHGYHVYKDVWEAALREELCGQGIVRIPSWWQW